MHALIRQQHRQRIVKQRVVKTVIQSIMRRRPHQDQHIIRVDAKLAQPSAESRVALKVGEINIFLRTVVTANSPYARSVVPQTLCGKACGNDYSRSKTKREMV